MVAQTYKLAKSQLVPKWCLVLGLFLGSLSCAPPPETDTEIGAPRPLRLATTTSTVQSGLTDRLLPVFESRTGIRVEVAALGTGKALASAREGLADVVLVHARGLEDQFVAEGYGINRRDVMYNDFVIVGPPEDTAGIREVEGVADALRTIADSEAAFVTRGDNSGTHAREMELWMLAGVKPQGEWYTVTHTGQLGALQKASLSGAYALSDRSTFLFNRESINLAIVMEGDERLFNPYGIIAVNPAKVAGVNYEAAMAFVDFMTSTEGQEIIAGYGALRFGNPLFHLLAAE